MDASPTELFLPSTFPYPIKITSLDVAQSAQIIRGTRLLSYSFVYLPSTSNASPETRFGTWDSAIEGKLSAWKINAGDVVSQKKARDRPVLVVIEPCKHGTQLGGLCVICGKDMTSVDYTGFSDSSRASIQMTHSAFGPTVSLEEAQRIERETAAYLLKSRRLSLIVDLDQTIVHATVDPTVGEWIAEGEAWESRQLPNVSSKGSPRNGLATPRTNDEVEDDQCNPNWEALKDVKRFRLGPESFGPPSLRAVLSRNKGKHNVVENEGCMYYIKPRPGWKEFLREISTKYEMHIYTMGTRAYAEEVCTAIDPDGNLFGGRILSRDESGSLTQKSLQRLFPCDTSMVVIIDDRADVWEWSPNLIKVIPYDFFIGIGDINSSFLPKVAPLTVAAQIPSPKLAAPNGSENPPNTALASDVDTLPADTEEIDAAHTEATALLTQNNAVLDAQLEERPLAKKQEELQVHEIEEQKQKISSSSTSTLPMKETIPQKLPKRALLKNDDQELTRIGNLLNVVHSRFFSAYDTRGASHSKRRGSISSKAYDVTRIIPRLRSDVFQGVHILFSSVIPLDTKPETTEVWKTAQLFGAHCSTELTSDITHVVAAKRGTVKVDMARRRGGIKIVWLAWFSDSIAVWQRQDEAAYLMDSPPHSFGSKHPTNMNIEAVEDQRDRIKRRDLEDGDDDWDQGLPEMKETGTLELGSINWDDINDEVEAAMNESDDEDGGGAALSEYSMQSGHVSEEEFTDGNSITGSAASSPHLGGLKRSRSETPPGGVKVNSDDSLRSPLAKRKRLVSERSDSKLKQGFVAEDLAKSEAGLASNGSASALGTPTVAVSTPKAMEKEEEAEEDEDDDEADDEEEEDEEKGDEDDDDDDSTDSDSSEDDDDFLTRALEQDMG